MLKVLICDARKLAAASTTSNPGVNRGHFPHNSRLDRRPPWAKDSDPGARENEKAKKPTGQQDLYAGVMDSEARLSFSGAANLVN